MGALLPQKGHRLHTIGGTCNIDANYVPAKDILRQSDITGLSSTKRTPPTSAAFRGSS